MVMGKTGERRGLSRFRGGRRRVRESMTIQTGLYRPSPKAPLKARPRPIPARSTGWKQDFMDIGRAIGRVATGDSPFPLLGAGMAGRGMQLRAIGRQQLARVPLPAKVLATGGAGLGAAAGIEVLTGKSPARILHDVGRRALGGPGEGLTPRRRPQMSPRGLAVHPSQHVVVRRWQTFPGGPVFERFSDGHIEVQKKDGTIKTFRPYRPVVIPRRWNARSMSRVATALKRQRKTATKILQITGGVPKRTVRVGGTHKMRGEDT